MKNGERKYSEMAAPENKSNSGRLAAPSRPSVFILRQKSDSSAPTEM